MAELCVKIWRVDAERAAALPLPAFATSHSAGSDLRAALDADLELVPGATVRVPTGFALAIPEGYEGQLRPRSGLAAEHGVTLLNAPGTIDSDYRGEVQILLVNLGPRPVQVRRGDRIAQLVIAPVLRVRWEEVRSAEQLGTTDRSTGGFGHTGLA